MVEPDDLVLQTEYFGFPSDLRDLKTTGAWVLQDACQALYVTPNWEQADFVLLSPRKFFGVPDGGLLVSRPSCDLLAVLSPLRAPNRQWWNTALSACWLRRQFDLNGTSQPWFQHYQRSETEQPMGSYSMSTMSDEILAHGIDYVTASVRRRENYRTLLDALATVAIFPDLPSDVVPLGFPIRLAHRDRFRQIMFQNNIFPQIHWLAETLTRPEFEQGEELRREILTLPCDQRYNRDQMEWMAHIVRKHW